MKTLKNVALSLLAFGISTAAFAQESGTSKSSTWKNHPYAKVKNPEGNGSVGRQADSGQHMQASGFLDRRAKKWTVGLRGGATAFHGDADAIAPSWNAGLFLKYSISQTFALRGEYNMGNLKGSRSDQGPSLFKDNFEFSSNYNDWNIQAQFTLGNISFIRPLRKTQMYLFAGIGQGIFKSEANFTDNRLTLGDYYLNSYFGQGTPNPNLGQEVTETYEGTHLILPFGFGLKHYLNKSFDLGLEYRLTYVRSDDVDVYNTQIWQNRWLDMYSNLNLTIGYKFGNKNPQHYDWLNPVESVYDKMAALDEKVDKLATDEDKDGVSDFFDKETETPEDCNVYGSGKSVDTDGDGIPDCKDEEPFTPRGVAVDENGKALDEDGDGVPDSLDKEPNTPAGVMVDRNGVQIKSCCDNNNLPSTYFSTSTDATIKPNQFNELHNIGERMKLNPDKKLVISAPAGSGKGKGSKYNSSVNARRIDAIIKHLSEKHGISRDRLVPDYDGSQNTNTDPDHKDKRVDFQMK